VGRRFEALATFGAAADYVVWIAKIRSATPTTPRLWVTTDTSRRTTLGLALAIRLPDLAVATPYRIQY